MLSQRKIMAKAVKSERKKKEVEEKRSEMEII